MSLTQTRRSAPRLPTHVQITVIGLFKTELVELHGPWRTRTEAELAMLEYINWFNTARLHGELDHVPPREYEEAHYRPHHPDLVGAGNHT